MLHYSRKYGQLLLEAHQEDFSFERTLKEGQRNEVTEAFSEFSLL